MPKKSQYLELLSRKLFSCVYDLAEKNEKLAKVAEQAMDGFYLINEEYALSPVLDYKSELLPYLDFDGYLRTLYATFISQVTSLINDELDIEFFISPEDQKKIIDHYIDFGVSDQEIYWSLETWLTANPMAGTQVMPIA